MEAKSDWSSWLKWREQKLCRAKISGQRVIHSGTERFDANEKATRQRGGLLFKGE
jgi:hypothetical protein